MIAIDELKRIQLTKGDNAQLNVRLLNFDLDEVCIDSEDVINLRVFDVSTHKMIMEKNNSKECLDTIFIYPEDTEDIDPGLYIYDVTLYNKYDEVDTIIPMGWFRLRSNL